MEFEMVNGEEWKFIGGWNRNRNRREYAIILCRLSVGPVFSLSKSLCFLSLKVINCVSAA